MNIIDLRNKLQQSSAERRVSPDRRKVSYQFGSAEWLEYMKKNQIKCLEEERRKEIRRSIDKGDYVEQSDSSNTEITYRRIFLTRGEKKLLQDIYLSDLD
jgi:hypothetical protein